MLKPLIVGVLVATLVQLMGFPIFVDGNFSFKWLIIVSILDMLFLYPPDKEN